VIGEVGSVAVGEMNRTKVRVTRTVGEHVGGGGEDRGRQPNTRVADNGPPPRNAFAIRFRRPLWT